MRWCKGGGLRACARARARADTVATKNSPLTLNSLPFLKVADILADRRNALAGIDTLNAPIPSGDPRDTRDTRDTRDIRDTRDTRDTRDIRDTSDTCGTRSTRSTHCSEVELAAQLKTSRDVTAM